MKKETHCVSDPIKKLIIDAGVQSPGEDFHLSVLNKIESLQKTSAVYQPVISSLGWKLIFGFISSIFGGSILFIPSESESSSLFDKLPSVNLPLPDLTFYNFKIPTVDFSPPFLIGIMAFFILGFIMIVGTLRNKQVSV
ncbi:MAG: hypothetical protein C0433_13665 [Cyclobacterium sp.]|nr:hypothetical protein [Cyclobacterium sp.]